MFKESKGIFVIVKTAEQPTYDGYDDEEENLDIYQVQGVFGGTTSDDCIESIVGRLEVA